MADEAVGCTRIFLTMWRSSRRLVCRGLPEPGLHQQQFQQSHRPFAGHSQTPGHERLSTSRREKKEKRCLESPNLGETLA
ncbi:hypothetical protein TNCV_1457061 [Trichonephila clavipes]|nr:hypothetical protein TNCV_1457061 [Trichonephila clavipes]